MDIKELSVGHFVSYEKTTHIVTGIMDNYVYSWWFNKGEPVIDYIIEDIGGAKVEHPYKDDINRYEPIPLTEEWHNRFGVIKNGFHSFEYPLPRKNNIDVKVIFTGDYVFLRQGKGNHEDDVVSIWNKDLTKRDMYVHEWQKLYFSLTGEELKVVN
jgi:hypothetical protein